MGLSLRSQVHYLDKLPTLVEVQQTCDFVPRASSLVIYDKELLNHKAEWLEALPLTYPVKGGEWLKSLENFPLHMKNIVELTPSFNRKSSFFLAVGGGTIGDFSGFVASTFKRGVPLVLIPSTWLSAIDSAHGGKNALNLGAFKNQVGTFFPPQDVFVVKELLQTVPEDEIRSARGEMVKMALIAGGDLYNKIWHTEKLDVETMWELLPLAIEAKYKVVELDPFETKGERQVLNLGHTLGHALEGACGIRHGRAVTMGMWFALDWGLKLGFVDAHKHKNISEVFERLLEPRDLMKQQVAKKVSRNEIYSSVQKDKKLTSAEDVCFVFIEAEGAVSRKQVSLKDLADEAQAQGWCS